MDLDLDALLTIRPDLNLPNHLIRVRDDVLLERVDELPAKSVLAVVLQHGEARELSLGGDQTDSSDGLGRGDARVGYEERDVVARVVVPASISYVWCPTYSSISSSIEYFCGQLRPDTPPPARR